jgi:hypothetical protein
MAAYNNNQLYESLKESKYFNDLIEIFSCNKQLEKNIESVLKEFGEEKWAFVLKKIKQIKPSNATELENIYFNIDSELQYVEDGKLKIHKYSKVYDKIINYINNEIKPYITTIDGICELGAGYGSKILKLSENKIYSNKTITALELTDSGRDCIEEFKNINNIKVSTGYCNFTDKNIDYYKIKPNSILYTFYAVHYMSCICDEFFRSIIKAKPKIVLHFEPVYGYLNGNDKYNILCRKYIKHNNYNENLLGALKQAEKNNIIKIISEKRNIIGTNPVLPMSIISWVPAG